MQMNKKLLKRKSKGTSSGFVTLLSQLQVAQITGIRAVDSTLMALQPDKIFKAEEELNIELTSVCRLHLRVEERVINQNCCCGWRHKPKIIQRKPESCSLCRMDWCRFKLRPKGTYNLKHYFRYTVKVLGMKMVSSSMVTN